LGAPVDFDRGKTSQRMAIKKEAKKADQVNGRGGSSTFNKTSPKRPMAVVTRDPMGDDQNAVKRWKRDGGKAEKKIKYRGVGGPHKMCTVARKAGTSGIFPRGDKKNLGNIGYVFPTFRRGGRISD